MGDLHPTPATSLVARPIVCSRIWKRRLGVKASIEHSIDQHLGAQHALAQGGFARGQRLGHVAVTSPGIGFRPEEQAVAAVAAPGDTDGRCNDVEASVLLPDLDEGRFAVVHSPYFAQADDPTVRGTYA